MPALLPRTCLAALCCLTLPVMAQDASFGFGQQSTETSQTAQTSTTQSQSQRSDDTAFGSSGLMTSQSSTHSRTHSESNSENTGVDLEIGVPDDTDRWGQERRHPRDLRDSDLFGTWTLGEENGNTCTIELKSMEWFGGYSAYVPAGCPEGFFPANRWLLSGNQLLLTDTSNTVYGRFRASGGGRWSGFRESDGARLYLNPKGR